MFNKTNLIYLILMAILIILVIAVVVFPSQKQSADQTQPGQLTFPTPTTVQVVPTPFTPNVASSSGEVGLISPTNTGVNENVPQPTLDYSLQKQALRQKTPLTAANFKITFDYANDDFIVTPTSPSSPISQTFPTWLKQNYPLLPMSQFVLQ